MKTDKKEDEVRITYKAFISKFAWFQYVKNLDGSYMFGTILYVIGYYCYALPCMSSRTIRKQHGHQAIVVIHLSTALLLGYLVFLLGIDRSDFLPIRNDVSENKYIDF